MYIENKTYNKKNIYLLLQKIDDKSFYVKFIEKANDSFYSIRTDEKMFSDIVFDKDKNYGLTLDGEAVVSFDFMLEKNQTKNFFKGINANIYDTVLKAPRVKRSVLIKVEDLHNANVSPKLKFNEDEYSL